MLNISIISSSVRLGRKSHRAALYFKKYLAVNNLATAEILDLKEYNFPIFEERLKNLKSPSLELVDFGNKIKLSDGIIIVTPEYNGGYPASLKNVIDVLYAEWHHKPIAIVTVSNGVFGGAQVITSLQFTLWKIHAHTSTVTFPVPKIEEVFNELGDALNESAIDEQADLFIKEFMWCIHANK
jgi:NAD(P)H-dependent FMN reductase